MQKAKMLQALLLAVGVSGITLFLNAMNSMQLQSNVCNLEEILLVTIIDCLNFIN